MDRGEKLYPTEVHAILKLNEERYSVTKIAKLINKSREVIVNLLKDSNNYEKRKSCGRSRLYRIFKFKLDCETNLQKKL